jgi:deazaflavin-dependent oxidoreductase (nitroreductase family)
LTTVGAKTGVERTHIVGGFPEGENAWLVVASNGGSADHPQWFVNMAKNPDQISIQVGERKLQVAASCLIGPERIEALNRVAAIAPRYGDYPKKTDREIPVIRLTAAA